MRVALFASSTEIVYPTLGAFQELDEMLQQHKKKVGEIFQDPKQNLDDMLSRAQDRFAKVTL